MRTFLAAYSLNPVDDNFWKDRFLPWRSLLPGGSAQHASLGRLGILLGGEFAISGLRLVQEEEKGRITLFIGPRTGLETGRSWDLETQDLSTLAANPELYSKGRETTACISHDRRDGGLIVKTDLLNSTFLYYLQADGFVFLSDSSRVLSRLSGSGLEPESIMEFVATGSIYGNKSLYKGIKTLEPSRFFKWDSQGVRSSSEYWKIADIPFGSLDLKQGTDRIIDLLDADFRRLKQSGGQFVFDLTGGYDSRCNIAFALRNGLPCRTTVSGPTSSGDVVIAKTIAAKYGLTLTHAPYVAPSLPPPLLDEAAHFTDGEYDDLEYSNILQIHSKHFASGEISVHGSTADIMRNYFLLREFYRPNPDGELLLDNVIGKKFTSAIPTRGFFPGTLGQDWASHMQAQISAVDLPGLPAFARLDNIYLRIRMQFWQGRISSSTNRIHPSFTPWTNHEVLETILATRWDVKKRGMLSRNILLRTGLGLDLFPLDGPGAAGIGLAAEARGLPRTFSYYGVKAWQRYVIKPTPRPHPQFDWLVSALSASAPILEPYFSGAVLSSLAPGTPYSFQVLSRLYTVLTAIKASAEG